MTNVIEFKKKDSFGESVSKETPESDTLLMLCSYHAVRVFEIESVDNGSLMVLAHFAYDGWNYLYQCGQGALSAHLFFFVTAWKGEQSAQDMALEFFSDGVVI